MVRRIGKKRVTERDYLVQDNARDHSNRATKRPREQDDIIAEHETEE